MLRPPAVLLLLLLTAAGAYADSPPGELWEVRFRNDDRVRGRLRRIRRGQWIFHVGAARTFSVALKDIERAERIVQYGDEPSEAPEILRMADGSVLTGRLQRIVKGRIEFEVANIGVVAFSPAQVADYMPPDEIVRAHVRALQAESEAPRISLTAARFGSLWDRLGSGDTEAKLHAHGALLSAGADAVPYLLERLRALPDTPERIRELIASLGDRDPDRRDRAQSLLFRIGQPCVPYLTHAARTARSPEARRRALGVLAEFESTTPPPMPEMIRAQAAIQLLRLLGLPEARDALEEIARGDSARISEAARSALARMDVDPTEIG